MRIGRAHVGLSVLALAGAAKARDRHEQSDDEMRRDVRRLLQAIWSEERRRLDVTA